MSNTLTFWLDLKEQYVSLLAKSKGEIRRIVQFKGAFCILVENIKRMYLNYEQNVKKKHIMMFSVLLLPPTRFELQGPIPTYCTFN